MRAGYKEKLFVDLLLLVSIFSAGILLLGETQEHRHRTRLLAERLDTYAELIHATFAPDDHFSLSPTLRSALPADLRLTLISPNGTVLFDNHLAASTINYAGDHSQRPEIVEASRKGTGIHRRMSVSTHREYLYYAKRYDTCFVRVALPYDTTVRDFFAAKSDRLFLYCILVIFTAMLFVIRYVANRFGKSVKEVNDSALQQGRSNERVVSTKNTHRLKQEMTGNVAHELRTPVTSIRGYLETLLDPSLPPEAARQFILKAHHQAIVLSELIRDMGILMNIDESSRSFSPTAVHLPTLLTKLTLDLEDNLKKQSIKVTCIGLDDVTIRGNDRLLYSIFRNLIDNVVQHAGFGAHIRISKEGEDGRFYVISFYDDGMNNLQEDHLKHLFERFYRASEGRVHDAGGTGLGLSIVRNALFLLGGNIAIDKPNGGGLQFTLRLPAANLNNSTFAGKSA
ncbi:MAG: HAMP domain-containing histidine kinase [Tannerellaceae bacterium]|jgi:signal transduction histidine kinase|nr:HAMP domain-containing histidine kinase [Tannerellaceae bacterium]